jgi:hypothetical protein
MNFDSSDNAIFINEQIHKNTQAVRKMTPGHLAQ